MSAKDNIVNLDRLFDFIQLPYANAPVQFYMALPGTGINADSKTGFSIPEAALPQAGRIASGRGLTGAKAETSCRGELVELISSCSWERENLVTSSYRDLTNSAIHPHRVLGFSQQHYANRDRWNRSIHLCLGQ